MSSSEERHPFPKKVDAVDRLTKSILEGEGREKRCVVTVRFIQRTAVTHGKASHATGMCACYREVSSGKLGLWTRSQTPRDCLHHVHK